jgi:hypothetical protein
MFKKGITISSKDNIDYRRVIKMVKKSTKKLFYLFSDTNPVNDRFHSHYHIAFVDELTTDELTILEQKAEELRNTLKKANKDIFYHESINDIDRYLFNHDFMIKCE